MRSLSPGVVPARKHVVEPTRTIGHHTASISLNRHDLAASRCDLTRDVAIDKVLAQQTWPVAHVVPKRAAPRVDKHVENSVEAIGGPDRQGHAGPAPVRYRRVQVVAREVGNPRQQRRVALREPVLQCCGEVDLPRGIRLRGCLLDSHVQLRRLGVSVCAYASRCVINRADGSMARLLG
jgi:hypothetical protein